MRAPAVRRLRAVPPDEREYRKGFEYTSPLEVLVLCNRLQGRMNQVLEEQGKEVKLSGTELMALLSLVQGPSTVSGIAAAVGLQSNGMSILVDRLSNRGLVTRRRSRQDRRVVTVNLTPAGRHLASGLSGVFGERVEQLLSAFSESERMDFVSMLQRVTAVHS